MNQPSLFEGETFSRVFRQSDPATSREAGEQVNSKLNELQSLMLTAFNAGPKTANEAAVWCLANRICPTDNRETLRKRAGELRKRGLICEIDSRKCDVTKTKATVFGVRN